MKMTRLGVGDVTESKSKKEELGVDKPTKRLRYVKGGLGRNQTGPFVPANLGRYLTDGTEAIE